MDDLNVLNIPAFQRKRSISAHAKKQASYMRAKSTVRVDKPTARVDKPEKKTRVRRSIPRLEESLIDIPTRQTYPSQDLFPEPMFGTEEYSQPEAKNSTFREMKICGKCEGYFDKIDVAVVLLTSALHVGDSILFETNDGLFEQEVLSMQIDRKDISIARAGSDIGLKVLMPPKVGGLVYKSI
jgi:hypothetical protein